MSSQKVEPDEINLGLEKLGSSPIREKAPLLNLLKRPQLNFGNFRTIHGDLDVMLTDYDDEVTEQVEINLKYESYIDKERNMADKISELEDFRIPVDFDYELLKAISAEGKQKLKSIRPETIGQASRISGVYPADISILLVYLGR